MNLHPIDVDNRLCPVDLNTLLPKVTDNHTLAHNYVSKGKAVATTYNIPGYRLLALKLDKAEKNFKVSVDQHGAKDSGVFGLIPMSTFELYHSSALTEPYKIKEIKLSTLESPIATEIYNDSIKSYYSAFKEFSLQINDDGDLQLHSSNDGLITNHNSAEWLFYTINETVYLFMMQRSDLKDIKKGTLYRYLFPNQQLVTKSM